MSDMLNSIAKFVDENPDWREYPEAVQRMSLAYYMFTKMGDPDMTTQDEYDFIIGIHTTLKEIRNG